MSQHNEKTPLGRSTRLIPKSRFELWLWDDNYDWLFHASRDEGITMARKLNMLLCEIRAVLRGIDT